jgi:predicted negative regulator of RcsB-dependent stress response
MISYLVLALILAAIGVALWRWRQRATTTTDDIETQAYLDTIHEIKRSWSRDRERAIIDRLMRRYGFSEERAAMMVYRVVNDMNKANQ